MATPQVLRTIDQFLTTETDDHGQLVAKFSLPAAMLSHCPGNTGTTYTLTMRQLDQKMAGLTMENTLRPEKQAAQLEQYANAMRLLQK